LIVSTISSSCCWTSFGVALIVFSVTPPYAHRTYQLDDGVQLIYQVYVRPNYAYNPVRSVPFLRIDNTEHLRVLSKHMIRFTPSNIHVATQVFLHRTLQIKKVVSDFSHKLRTMSILS